MHFCHMPKVILSRKGVDSGSGGMASPILENRLVSLPIPDSRSAIRYSSIKDDFGMSYGAIISQLSGKRPAYAHLDPDLIYDDQPRMPGWKPTFGQCNASLSHLRREGVGVGDLFLFFGWFREAKKHQGKWRFKSNGLNAHIIFGWMEIGEIIDLATATPPDWLVNHPHCQPTFTHNSGGNALFVAKEHSSFWKGKPGAGTFSLEESFQLTELGSPRRSDWQLPGCFFDEQGMCTLSYHRHKRGILDADTRKYKIKAANRGQEFVGERDREVEDWVKKLV